MRDALRDGQARRLILGVRRAAGQQRPAMLAVDAAGRVLLPMLRNVQIAWRKKSKWLDCADNGLLVAEVTDAIRQLGIDDVATMPGSVVHNNRAFIKT